MADIKTKIQKLLRLSQNNPNLNEALLAAKRANELAEKFNIAIEILHGEEYSFENEIVDFIFEMKHGFWKNNPDKWEIVLAKAVAENNGCRVTIASAFDGENKHEGLLNIIGRRRDIDMASIFISGLHTQISMLMVGMFAQLKRTPYDRVRMEDWKNAFCAGAVAKIKEKLEEASNEARKEMIDKMEGAKDAIVRLDERLSKVDQFMASMNLEEGKSESIAENLSAFAKGYKAADKIDISSNSKTIEAKDFAKHLKGNNNDQK